MYSVCIVSERERGRGGRERIHHITKNAPSGQRRTLGTLELEFQLIVRYLLWTLGTKP